MEATLEQDRRGKEFEECISSLIPSSLPASWLPRGSLGFLSIPNCDCCLPSCLSPPAWTLTL
ncbi:mCG1026161, isoform CRA_a [Mus musculus]|nr:mCG1026161, isoform CRA_a [Mus musculus]